MNRGSVWWEGEDTVSRRWHCGLLESKGWGVFWGPGGGDVVGLAGGHWREKVGWRLREGNGRCVRRRLLIGRRQLHCLSLHPGLDGKMVRNEAGGMEKERIKQIWWVEPCNNSSHAKHRAAWSPLPSWNFSFLWLPAAAPAAPDPWNASKSTQQELICYPP